MGICVKITCDNPECADVQEASSAREAIENGWTRGKFHTSKWFCCGSCDTDLTMANIDKELDTSD